MTTQFRPKIALLGSGMIGGTAAALAALNGMAADVVLLDVVDDMPKGKALDIGQAAAVRGVTAHPIGYTGIGPDAEALRGADVVIVTAGFPRKPGMTREDLLARNAEVISNVGAALKALCPGAFVICITNPLDVMVALLQKTSGIPAARVVGMAGLLDSSRFRYFLAEELKVATENIHAMVLGGHGDDMVPLISATSVGGIPLQTLISMGVISQARVDEIVARTRQGGGEIVALLKMGSAYLAPAVCALEMAQAYLRDEKRIIPCSAYVPSAYGLDGCYAGVPCVIGAGGVERVIEIPLAGKERELFAKSVASVKAARAECAKLGFAL